MGISTLKPNPPPAAASPSRTKRAIRWLLRLLVGLVLLLAIVFLVLDWLGRRPQPPETLGLPIPPPRQEPTWPDDTAVIDESGVTIIPFTLPKLTPKKAQEKGLAHVEKLLNSVLEQTQITRSYDPRYVPIKYPGGDVPMTTGVCADVIVRAFRTQGIDLQQALHEDMRRHFDQYPKKWGLKRADPNIDHRRVYNLMRFFERQGKALPISNNHKDYLPGDIVAWDLGNGQAHIGIVTQFKTKSGRPLIGHNVAYGTNIEDALFFWPIIGHYRYFAP